MRSCREGSRVARYDVWLGRKDPTFGRTFRGWRKDEKETILEHISFSLALNPLLYRAEYRNRNYIPSYWKDDQYEMLTRIRRNESH